MLAAIGEFFREAGSFIFINIAIFGLAIIIATVRLWSLHWMGRISGLPFIAHIDRILNRDTLQAAKTECERWPNAAVPEIIRVGLDAAPEGDEAVERAVQTVETVALLRALTGHKTLTTFANLAVYLGLIGTIISLVTPFCMPSSPSPETRTILMLKGLAGGMHHTAFGLLVAAFCSFAQLGIRSLTQKALADIMVTSEYIKLALRERREWMELAAAPTADDTHPPPPMWAIDRYIEEGNGGRL